MSGGRSGFGGRALGACVALALSASSARGDDLRLPGARMLFGLNIDFFPRVLEDADLDPAYKPQLWVGIGSERLRFTATDIELPEAITIALKWFRSRATRKSGVADDDYDTTSEEAMGEIRFAHWQGRAGHRRFVRAVRWPRQALRVRCGYSWRLALDFARPPWNRLKVVLEPQTVVLLATLTPAPIRGDVLFEVVWFRCGAGPGRA